MNKCKNCDYYANKYGYGQCYGQKNAPQVDDDGCCEDFVPAKDCASEPAMTNIDAEKIMRRWYLNGTDGMTDERLGYIEGWFNKEDKLAFELAIKALKASTAEPEKPQDEWVKNEPVSCGTIMHWRASVVECQCPKCKRWCLKWSDVLDYDFCPNCGADICVQRRKTNERM